MRVEMFTAFEIAPADVADASAHKAANRRARLLTRERLMW
jgi:hypothetical protein